MAIDKSKKTASGKQEILEANGVKGQIFEHFNQGGAPKRQKEPATGKTT